MNDKSVKRILILLIVMGVVIVGSFSVGTSYALLEGKIEDENTQVIQSGSVSLELTEYFDSINNKISLMKDEEGLLSDNVYNFNVKNTGSAATLYSLILKKDVPTDYKGKVLEDKYIKVGLEINGEETGPYNLEEVKSILVNKQKIESKELISFKMRIWLDESLAGFLNDKIDAKTFYKLNVLAEQDIKEENNDLTTNK